LIRFSVPEPPEKADKLTHFLSAVKDQFELMKKASPGNSLKLFPYEPNSTAKVISKMRHILDLTSPTQLRTFFQDFKGLQKSKSDYYLRVRIQYAVKADEEHVYDERMFMDDLRMLKDDLFIRRAPLQIANAELACWLCGSVGSLWSDDIGWITAVFERYQEHKGIIFPFAIYCQQPRVGKTDRTKRPLAALHFDCTLKDKDTCIRLARDFVADCFPRFSKLQLSVVRAYQFGMDASAEEALRKAFNKQCDYARCITILHSPLLESALLDVPIARLDNLSIRHLLMSFRLRRSKIISVIDIDRRDTDNRKGHHLLLEIHSKPSNDGVSVVVSTGLQQTANLLLCYAPAFLLKFFGEVTLNFVTDAGKDIARDTTWNSKGMPVSSETRSLQATLNANDFLFMDLSSVSQAAPSTTVDADDISQDTLDTQGRPKRNFLKRHQRAMAAAQRLDNMEVDSDTDGSSSSDDDSDEEASSDGAAGSRVSPPPKKTPGPAGTPRPANKRPYVTPEEPKGASGALG
jgi:hypothetical protein